MNGFNFESKKDQLKFVKMALDRGYDLSKILPKISLELSQKSISDLEHYLGIIADYIKIPKYEKNKDRTTKSKINKLHLFNNSFFIKDARPIQYSHELRVSCYSNLLMDFLGIKDLEARKIFFASSIYHDDGKSIMLEVVDKAEDFNKEDMEKIKAHPIIFYDSLKNIDERVAEIVKRHHSHQHWNPYPSVEYHSPFVDYFSKLLAVIDFYDSASTRINTKEGSLDNFLKKLESGKSIFPEKLEVKEKIFWAYKDIEFDCNDFPKIKGEKLINMLYEKNIFGRKNPVQPFNINNIWFSDNLKESLSKRFYFWYKINRPIKLV